MAPVAPVLVCRSAGWQPGELEGIEGVGVIVGSEAYWVRAAYFVAITWVMKMSVGLIGVVVPERTGVMVETGTVWITVGGIGSEVSFVIGVDTGEHPAIKITNNSSPLDVFISNL